jgi:hypothetical protein
MTKQEILNTIEKEMRECFLKAAIFNRRDEKNEEVSCIREAYSLHNVACKILGEKWYDRADDARSRAAVDGKEDYRKLYQVS